MEEEIKINAQSSIRLTDQETVIYLDPYLIEKEVNDADYIFITHDHYDHLSIEDINKVIKESTIIIIPESCSKSLEEFNNQIVKVKPNNKYLVGNLNFQTVASYNTNKLYHPEKNEWVGYLIDFNNKKYFITGDTDINKENKQIKCDVLLLPVGGVYTMDYNEAATLTNLIKPKLAIPTHYQTVVGTKIDAINYTNLLDKDIESKILY
mgnify:FL=1